MNWIYQNKDWGLGNFINITPIIKWIYDIERKPVPVYFESDYVADAFHEHEMIWRLHEKPDNPPIVSSRCHCANDSQEDFKFNFELITDQKYSERYKPCTNNFNKREAIIICGAGSEDAEYLNRKIPDPGIYLDLIHELRMREFEINFVGSKNDYDRNEVGVFCDNYFIDQMDVALTKIQFSDLVIGNDTGLIHASGCSDVPTFVLWKNTPSTRCKNSGKKSQYCSQDDDHVEEFNYFLNSYEI
jgi:ADP-heptose:LPS heptosyltransferase